MGLARVGGPHWGGPIGGIAKIMPLTIERSGRGAAPAGERETPRRRRPDGGRRRAKNENAKLFEAKKANMLDAMLTGHTASAYHSAMAYRTRSLASTGITSCGTR